MSKISVNELTIGEVKEIAAMVGYGTSGGGGQRFALPTGTNVLLRTVTHIVVGRLVEAGPQELVLQDASWVADTGRYAKFAAGELDSNAEVEPYPDGALVPVGRGALIDAAPWPGELPRLQK